MSQDSVITDEMRAMIGVESEPSMYEIEKAPIRRWAEAIGDDNPLYHDPEYAESKGYRGLVAPPGFVAFYAFPVQKGEEKAHFESPYKRRLNGGNDFEFFIPVQSGDTLTATTKLVELNEREGKMGKMLIAVSETVYKNQAGEIVAKARRTGISY